MNFYSFATYIVASALFIYALMWMNSPTTARRGVFAGVAGMSLAMIGTLIAVENYTPIVIGLVLGTILGVPLALVPLTAVPQRTALSHAFGALAAAIVGTCEYVMNVRAPHLSTFAMVAIVFETLLGYLTCTGSLMAAGKLQEWPKFIPTRPFTYKNQNLMNFGIIGLAALLGIFIVIWPTAWYLFVPFALLALTFGVLLILPIGGADMPTVIAILNSYAGLAAVAMGFVLDNQMLIIAGALDGSSGLILAFIMCKAMNRSFFNVLFGAFGQVKPSAAAAAEERTVRSASAEEAAQILDSARLVIIVPGYGMAVAQAQHKVRELYDLLTKRGVDVKFAIHPVAGRMPGHMNVLLAEADIPYDKLIEMDEINAEFPQADVALVIGANDVTNPAARHDKTSPIYGMPILDVDRAHTVMIIKRGMGSGFAAIENELFFMNKTLMLFGDAKAFVTDIVKEVGSNHH